MNISLLVIGLLLVISTIIALCVDIGRTPTNLQGWYGSMFVVLAVFGIIGGLFLSVLAFF